MCGIFGISMINLKRGKLSTKNVEFVKQLTKDLLIESESRGRDASGVCVTTDKEVNLYKHNCKGSNLVNTDKLNRVLDIGDDFVSVIGHTRAKTQGSERNNYNNHPIKYGNIVGVHNGIISNDAELFRRMDIRRIGQVDSEIIFALIDYYRRKGCSLTEASGKAASKLTGSFAHSFIDLNKPKSITISVGKTGPAVKIAVFSNENFMAFASTEDILSRAINKAIKKSSVTSLNTTSEVSVIQNHTYSFNTIDGSSVYRTHM